MPKASFPKEYNFILRLYEGKNGFVCLPIVYHYLHIPNTSNKILERHLQVWVKDPSGAFSDCVWKVNAIKLEFLVTEDLGSGGLPQRGPVGEKVRSLKG